MILPGLNNPVFQRNLLAPTREGRDIVIDALGKLLQLDRDELYRAPGSE